MTATESVQNLQVTENKTTVRNAIRQQIEAFAKQQGRLGLLSLPATGWIMENELLTHCKANKTPCRIIGLEKNPLAPQIFQAVQKNKPAGKNVEVFNEDFDNFLGCCRLEFPINVFWADYCGSFKKGFGYSFQDRYPHIFKFITEAKTLDKPFLYYMTFSLNGRIEGGRKGKDALGFVQEVKNIIALKASKLQVIPVFYIVYKGGGRSTMVTLGFACNMGKTTQGQFWKALKGLPNSIPFKPVQKKLLDNAIVNVKTKEVTLSQVNIKPLKSLRSSAIKILHKADMPNPDIATVLNLSRNQVGSVLAHFCNPTSFK